MADRIDTDVLIVGGGPVGLALAMDLAQRRIDVTLVEMRAAGEPPSVRANVVSARTMEAFRRLGIARSVREAGLPADYPNDVAIRTTATGFELARVPIPCRAKRYTEKSGPDGWWPTPEPPHRINQMFLEPVLFAAAAATPRIRMLNRVRVTDFEQSADGVSGGGEQSRQRQRTKDLCALSCRLRWRPFPDKAGDRRRVDRRCGADAGAVDLCPRPRFAWSNARPSLGGRLRQSTKSGPCFRNRRTGAMARPQVRADRRVVALRPAAERTRHPRPAAVFCVRDAGQGGLDGATHDRQPFP